MKQKKIPETKPLTRLWHWLTGSFIVDMTTTKTPEAGGKHAAPRNKLRRPHSRRFPVPVIQLAALTQALNSENARPHLPNLLVVEQTLLCVSGGNDLAAVPDFVLERARLELQCLAMFKRSKALQAFDEAMGQQVRRNDQAQQALSSSQFEADEEDDPRRPGARASNGGRVFVASSAAAASSSGEGDFEDTLPSQLDDDEDDAVVVDDDTDNVDEAARIQPPPLPPAPRHHPALHHQQQQPPQQPLRARRLLPMP